MCLHHVTPLLTDIDWEEIDFTSLNTQFIKLSFYMHTWYAIEFATTRIAGNGNGMRVENETHTQDIHGN